MKKQTLSLIAILLVSLSFSVGLSYVGAAWSEPGTTAPGNNLFLPITTTSTAQVKNGGLSVHTFLASANALFDDKVYLQGEIRGNTPNVTNRVLRIGGVSGSTTNTVETKVEGGVKGKDLGSEEIMNPQRFRLCADDEGRIIYCPQYAAIDPETPSLKVASLFVGVGYNNNGNEAWEGRVCLNKAATQSESFTIEYIYLIEEDPGYPPYYDSGTSSWNVNINAGDTCSDTVQTEAYPISNNYRYSIINSCVSPNNPSIPADPYQC